MRAPIIAITVHPEQAEGRDPSLAQDLAYFRSVELAGGIPLGIPPLIDPAALRRLYDLCDGVYLPGGDDVAPSRYGEAIRPGCNVVTLPEADRVEAELLGWALEGAKPILGVCRGMQLLNVVRGGSLWQDLHEDDVTGEDHQVRPMSALVHDVELASGTRLERLLGVSRLRVNSVHHQAARRIGDGLRVSATSPDGVVEGLELDDHPWCLGVQWHPEALPDDPLARVIFRDFVQAAAGRGREVGRP